MLKVINENYNNNGEILRDEIENAIEVLQNLLDSLDSCNKNSLKGDKDTCEFPCGFVGFTNGFIDLSDPEKYISDYEPDELELSDNDYSGEDLDI